MGNAKMKDLTPIGLTPIGLTPIGLTPIGPIDGC